MSRARSDTIPTLVPEIEIDRKIELAKDALRLEFVANIDRQALERAIADATSARELTDLARAVSLHRYLKVILVLAALLAGEVGQFVYAYANRARIDLMERAADHYRGPGWREWEGR